MKYLYCILFDHSYRLASKRDAISYCERCDLTFSLARLQDCTLYFFQRLLDIFQRKYPLFFTSLIKGHPHKEYRNFIQCPICKTARFDPDPEKIISSIRKVRNYDKKKVR